MYEHLKQKAGFDAHVEQGFIARRRHINALNRAQHYIQEAQKIGRDEQALEFSS